MPDVLATKNIKLRGREQENAMYMYGSFFWKELGKSESQSECRIKREQSNMLQLVATLRIARKYVLR